MPVQTIEIDLSESFPHLGRAPITEAVLDLKTRAESSWEEEKIREALQPRLPDYPKILSHHAKQFLVQLNGAPQQPSMADLGWTGLRCISSDDRQVAQFNRDAFTFSRLQPYENWERFSAEALRLWRIHLGLAGSTQIQRIGLRFVNQISVAGKTFEIDDYLVGGPKDLRDLVLPFAHFLHHDVLTVPGHPFGINLIRTIRPPAVPDGESALILDIDVFTTEPIFIGEGVLEQRIAQMRWLKNKIFFGSITQKAYEMLQ